MNDNNHDKLSEACSKQANGINKRTSKKGRAMAVVRAEYSSERPQVEIQRGFVFTYQLGSADNFGM